MSTPKPTPDEVLADCAGINPRWLESKQLQNIVTVLAEALREAIAQRDEARAVLEHALELGHLGDGSTAGWARQVIQKSEAGT